MNRPRIILRREAEHWDRVFALRPQLTHVEIVSWQNGHGETERDLDVYDRDHTTPLGLSAMPADNDLRRLLEECWEIDYPEDFE